MKPTLIIFLSFIAKFCFANMASPIWEGTPASTAFSSRDIDIQRENILIKIDKDFKTASYAIEYFIRCEKKGNQIPLLFLAKDYKEDFKVWVDNLEVKILDIPTKYTHIGASPFNKFSNSFEHSSNPNESESVAIYWHENFGTVYNFNDLKYFETSLTQGAHIIRVEYIADVWTNISNWVKEYSFRYSLSPARYWKSFGSMEVTLQNNGTQRNLNTNLGIPSTGRIDSVATWKYNKLPADFIQITYIPEISNLSNTLIKIGTDRLTILFGLFLFLLHLVSIIVYRKNALNKKYSCVVIIGSIIIPFLSFIGYIYSFDIIDRSIGEEAGKYHGYTFLIMILYPLVLPLYWLTMWFIDRTYKRIIFRKQNK